MVNKKGNIIGVAAMAGLAAIAWIGADRVQVVPEHETIQFSPLVWNEAPNQDVPEKPEHTVAVDTPEVDLPFPITDTYDQTNSNENGVDLQDPSNIINSVEYDPETGLYYFSSTVGGSFDYRPPTYMTLEEYLEYTMDQAIQGNWEEKIEEEEAMNSNLIPEIPIGGEGFAHAFGDNTINIRPQGQAQLSFGINISRTDNPQIPEKQRRIATFDFNEQIQLNVTGTIGTKMKLTTSYNTEATFDFENQMKLEYEGDEDQIIKKLEMGNVSMPLTSSLITGSQSLFGVKTQFQFGRTTVTSIFSQQKGQRKEIEIKGGAQVNDFEIKADNYEANKHFFLSSFFRNKYDDWMSSLPVVSSPVKITKIEVWITNTTNNYQNNRNLVAFSDVGETIDTLWTTDYTPAPFPNAASVTQSYPDNGANDLYANVASNAGIRTFTNATSVLAGFPFEASVHYEKLENARLLTDAEYTYNEKLGFISLNQALNQDEVLAVAFQYTVNGETYQVGEFSTDGIVGTDALVVKLLKPTITNPVIEGLWDLRMKNVYAIGAYQVNPSNFRMDVWYNDPLANIDRNYIPQFPIDGEVLVQVLNMDNLDQNLSPVPDGVMDFVDNAATIGGTINSRNGRIFFTTVEPFGSHLQEIFDLAGVDPNISQNIVYQSLYDSTVTAARNQPELNRFSLKGQYQSSSSSEIYLNAPNIPQGAVQVTANGAPLTEGQDYTVDYNLGRVTIINQGLLESGSTIKVSVESNALFSIQTKTLLGTHVDYKVNDDFIIGATWMNLLERPLTQKVNQGDEPINNHIFGVSLDYRTEAPFLTRWIDKLPFYETKEMSTITTRFEGAYLLPGHARAVGKEGIAYIDDFEGSQSTIDLRSFTKWVLASTPQGQPLLFPEGGLKNDPIYGMNRARLAWYTIDPLFHRDNGLRPSYMNSGAGLDMVSNHLMRQVLETEVFPNKQLATGTPTNIPVLDLAFYPSERGPYNFDTYGTSYSAGLNANGSLASPETRWGGIMREILTNDFEASNVEYIQFWMMDPFNNDAPGGLGTTPTGGDLYFNLGNISEDVLADGRKSFENGIPVDAYGSAEFDEGLLDTTAWGWVPVNPAIVNAFDTDPNSRVNQDVGFDGLINNLESSFFNNPAMPHGLTYIDDVNAIVTPGAARDSILNDPSADFYNYYRDDDYDALQNTILNRYKFYNGMDGNSPTTEQSGALNNDGYPTSGTTLPNVEDINQDNNLSETESYFQYHVSLRPGDMVVGQNYITDELTTTVTTENGQSKTIKWYQFKIPVRSPDAVVNNIQDFRSIRFLRMFLTGFDRPIVVRFARLELVRGEWRRYLFSLLDDGEYIPTDPDNTLFNIGAVNVEENGDRNPIPYEVPSDIQQEVDATSANLRRLNEQSLVLEVCGLEDGDARAAFKNVEFDVRSYKKLEMHIHGEAMNLDNPIDDDEITVFIRLGSDFTDNYYEYEVPVKMTNWGATDPDDIWPEANKMIIEFQQLLLAKQQRNANTSYPTYLEYTVPDPNDPTRLITVKGNPNLQGVKTIMIGIRNPNKDMTDHPWLPDDGLDKCAIVWVNELRLTDFDETGGWAAIANVNAQLADLGNLTLAGSISTPGFGSLEKRVSERSRETILQFDASSSLELSKFFGQETRWHIPVFLSYSEGVINPQFDPLNPDILWDDQRKALTKDEWKELKKQGQTYTLRRSFNFTNVRIDRKTGATAHFWDLSNWALTYAYNEQYMRDVNTEFNTLKTYRLGLNYTFNNQPTQWKPFQNVGLFKKSNWFKLIREFNVYLGPKQFGFRSDIFRSYNEQQMRALTEGAITIPQFTKLFNWTRAYDLKYDITKGIKLTFNANNQAVIGEPTGRVNRKVDPEGYEVFKDSVLQSISNFGETTQYSHKIDLNWTLPLSQFPMTDWMSVTTRYTTSYQWDRAPFSQDTMGHTIQNSRTINVTAQLNMINLYNKIPYLKRVNQELGTGSGGGRVVQTQTINTGDGNNDGDEDDKDSTKTVNLLKGFDYIARLLMSVKNINATFSSTDGTLLPGYGNTTSILGANSDFSAPGIPFLLGNQNFDLYGNETGDFAMDAAQNGWLINDSLLANMLNPHTVNHTINMNGRITIEPINHFRIEVTAQMNKADNMTSFFRYNDSIWNYQSNMWGNYEHQSLQQTGNFSMSIMTFSTAFVSDNDKNVSPTFEQFSANREIISDRLADLNPNIAFADYDSTGIYYNGYGGTAQDVVIPAFVAAYTGKDASKIKLNPFTYIPQPNWRITYDGLGKMEIFKKWFRNVTISHAYRSSFNIGSYTTNLLYQDLDQDGFSDVSDQVGNVINEKQITSVSITEQFSPLIMFDMTTKSDLLVKVELKRDRNMTLSLTNNQLTEVRGNEIVIGGGYDFKNVKVKFGQRTLESNLKLRVDVSIRSNKTITRKLVENQNQVTAGQNMVSIKTSADYNLNQNLSIRFYFDRVVTRPFISTTFPTANTNAGIALRFTLG